MDTSSRMPANLEDAKPVVAGIDFSSLPPLIPTVTLLSNCLSLLLFALQWLWTAREVRTLGASCKPISCWMLPWGKMPLNLPTAE